MPVAVQQSSSQGFAWSKYGRFASSSSASQPPASSLTERPQSSIIGKRSGSASGVGQRPRRGVGQEKGLLTQALKTSAQLGSVGYGQRPETVGSHGDRSHSRSPERVKLVHSTFWIDPRVRAEMERQAREEGMSFSEVGARACAVWVRYTIQQQQDDLFEPRLRHMMHQEIQALGERLVFFVMRNAHASEHTRIMTTDLYKRQLQKEGVSKEKFYELMDAGDTMATENITKRSPKFQGLLVQWEADFAKQGKEAAVN